MLVTTSKANKVTGLCGLPINSAEVHTCFTLIRRYSQTLAADGGAADLAIFFSQHEVATNWFDKQRQPEFLSASGKPDDANLKKSNTSTRVLEVCWRA